MAIKVNGTTVVDNSRNVTNLQNLSFDTITLNGTAITATADEINRVQGLVAPIDSQLSDIISNKATLNKSFNTNETASITLDDPLPTNEIPAISVVKEVPQVGVTNNNWQIDSNSESKYDVEDTAYSDTLTPSATSGEITLTLGSGSFSNDDVGKTISGNGGEAVLTNADGTAIVIKDFDDTSTISSGDWTMVGITFGNEGVSLSGIIGGGGGDVVAAYDFEGNLKDATPNGYDLEYFGNNAYGSAPGLNYRTGKSGQAFDTSPTDGLRNLSFPFFSGGMTLTGWINSDNPTHDNNQGVLEIGSYDGPDGFGIWLSSSGNLMLRINRPDLESSYTISANTWYHVAAVWDGSSTVKLYVNGNEELSYTNEVPVSSNELYIGSREVFEAFDGRIDEVIVYSKALTPTEVNNVYLNETVANNLTSIVNANQYNTAITNDVGQTITEFWTDINSISIDEVTNTGSAFYSFSTDERNSFQIVDSGSGTRSIVRNNSGTWQYNSSTTYSSETWTNSSENSVYGAFKDAMSISINQMDSSQLESVQSSDFFSLTNTLDFSVTLFTDDSEVLVSSEGASINYDANVKNQNAVLGADYKFDFPANDTVRFTALSAENFRIVVA